ncbi:MAG: TonB-dependent receptor [Rickettsiales bacterium]|nr:TonB-dependent receptor [Rickettsiales bacterium]
MNMNQRSWRFWATFFGAIGSGAVALAAPDAPDFLNVSLDQLADIEVTSVSKRSEKASEAAAAIYVITQEDIRRSGYTSIPEALRMVPGLHVARSGSSQWAVTARGFNDQFANKLLVLMDGRTLYSPIFSGVWWDVQDTVMEDIERIEVIRGPGATLWGANAVNGVINIITKKAKDTQGALISGGGGNEEAGFGVARYGFKLGDFAHMRAYAKYDNRDESKSADARTGSSDHWNIGRYGFRMDWDMDKKNDLTIQGDMYTGREHQLYTVPEVISPFSTTVKDDQETKGANILMRWSHRFNRNSNITLQTYFDYNDRDVFPVELSNYTYDIDFQHHWTINAYNDFVWGLGYRYIEDDTNGSFYIRYVPESDSRHLFSAFAQDKIALIRNELYLTLGTKFEHNQFTGAEFQPSGRLSWLIDDSQTLWASVARAVRTPSRAAQDLVNPVANLGGTALVVRRGSKNDSEEMIAYELGYRIQPADQLAFDFAAFYNDYDKLISGAPGAARLVTNGGITYLEIPQILANGAEAESYGIEVAANWTPYRWWKLRANYSYMELDFSNNAGSLLLTDGKTPSHQAYLSSSIDLPYDIEFDQSLLYVDELDPNATLDIADYLRLDLRLGWQPVEGLDISLVGQNLLDPYHPEFSAFLYNPVAQIGRSVYGKVTWQY